MAKVPMTRGKFEGLQACANERGIIAAAAMDQRGSLQKSIAKGRGVESVSAAELAEFKSAVTKVLTPYASAILLDPEYGLEAARLRASGRGLLLAYEKTGYDATQPGRLPDLLDEWSVARLVEAGATAIKILLYYTPFDEQPINEIKHAFIERVGAECAAYDVPFFLEPVGYDPSGGSEKSLAFARRKPEIVARYMEEFSRPRYGVDILKVEVPFNIEYVEGSRANKSGEVAYTRDEALQIFRDVARSAGKPFIYLSAGVDNDVFNESLEMAAEAEVPFSGVLCGRATWKEGIPVFARGGRAALEEWLSDQGVKNIRALNAVLDRGAKAWYEFYGGLDNIEVVDSPPRPR